MRLSPDGMDRLAGDFGDRLSGRCLCDRPVHAALFTGKQAGRHDSDATSRPDHVADLVRAGCIRRNSTQCGVYRYDARHHHQFSTQ